MTYDSFKSILRVIEQDITRHQVIGGHKVLKPEERLSVALRFLATGETFRSLSFQYRISINAISYIVQEVCESISG